MVIAAVAAMYWVYNAGYWLPMGGGSTGPLRAILPLDEAGEVVEKKVNGGEPGA